MQASPPPNDRTQPPQTRMENTLNHPTLLTQPITSRTASPTTSSTKSSPPPFAIPHPNPLPTKPYSSPHPPNTKPTSPTKPTTPNSPCSPQTSKTKPSSYPSPIAGNSSKPFLPLSSKKPKSNPLIPSPFSP